MSPRAETRSDRRKSKDGVESFSVPPAQPGSGGHGTASRLLAEGYGPHEFLVSLPDCFLSSLKEGQLDAIPCSVGMDRMLMVLPGVEVMLYDRAPMSLSFSSPLFSLSSFRTFLIRVCMLFIRWGHRGIPNYLYFFFKRVRPTCNSFAACDVGK